MYHLRHLTAQDRRLFSKALRGTSDDLFSDPDNKPDEHEDEGTDDPKGGDTPTTPGSDPGGNPMRFVTANLRHGMSVASKREDILKVRGLGSVIMWQEMGGTSSSRSLLRHHLPESDWYSFPQDEHIPTRISVKRSLWDVDQSAHYLMHGKNPAIKHGARETYVTLALIRLRGANIQFLVTNSHFVSHAWCNHNVPAKQWRKDKWTLHYNKFQSIVLDARSKGITVIGGGDWNNPSVNKFHTSQVWFRQARLDYLFGLAATGGAQFTMQSNQSVALNSDHNALVAQLAWTAGTNSLKSGYNWPGL